MSNLLLLSKLSIDFFSLFVFLQLGFLVLIDIHVFSIDRTFFCNILVKMKTLCFDKLSFFWF